MEHYNGGLRGSKWVKKKRCKKGEHAIGAEIGLHDDFGLSNYKEKWQHFKEWMWLYYYFASILNIRLYCSDYGEGGTRIVEGELRNDFYHERQDISDMFKEIRKKQR